MYGQGEGVGEIGGAAGLRVCLLGGLQVESAAGAVVTRFRTHKTGMLLAYLAFHLGRSRSRDQVVELLWPDDSPEAARKSLSTALWSLKQDLSTLGDPEAGLAVDRNTLRLVSGPFTCDLTEFEAALRLASRERDPAAREPLLARAVELYRGEFLLGHSEEWIFPEQTRLAVAYQEALQELADHYEQRGDLAAAREMAARLLREDPLDEGACHRLMRLYIVSGHRAATLAQYRLFERQLREELGVAPSAALQALAQELVRTPRNQPVSPSTQVATERLLFESASGAVPLDSTYYITREVDQAFHWAVARRESILLLTGPRQTGKTSLLARGLQEARAAGSRVVLTDLQSFSAAEFADSSTFFIALAGTLADQLNFPVWPRDVWRPERGPSLNLRRYLLREVLSRLEEPLIWGLDETDRLFPTPFAGEVFGLFRSWHNERALGTDSPWSHLTLTMAYATEANLFISDLSQSPFNVGLRFELGDFTPDEVRDLNLRHGEPLSSPSGVEAYLALVGGHPYLVRRGLHEMVRHGVRIAEFRAAAARDGGIYKDHLRRIVLSLHRDPALCAAVRGMLLGESLPSDEAFSRLRSAGLLCGEAPEVGTFRCELYRLYLTRHLLEGPAINS